MYTFAVEVGTASSCCDDDSERGTSRPWRTAAIDRIRRSFTAPTSKASADVALARGAARAVRRRTAVCSCRERISPSRRPTSRPGRQELPEIAFAPPAPVHRGRARRQSPDARPCARTPTTSRCRCEHVERPAPRHAPRPRADGFVQGLRGAHDGALDGPAPARTTGSELVILTATSGDTGSAVAHAYHGVPRRPRRRALPDRRGLEPPAQADDHARRERHDLRRRRQVRRLPGHGQARLRRPRARAHLRLTSANSINIGRLLPQAVYYFYAYVAARRRQPGRADRLLRPVGQLRRHDGRGLAPRMGLPIDRLVIATNANDEVPGFLATGSYEKSSLRACASPTR